MTIKELIEACGGTVALAALLGCRPHAVAMWPSNGAVPAKYHWKVYQHAQKRSIEITMEDLSALGQLPPPPSGD